MKKGNPDEFYLMRQHQEEDMESIIDLLKLTGLKTYISAIGSIAFGVYLITESKVEEGIAAILFGMNAFGFRAAMAKK